MNEEMIQNNIQNDAMFIFESETTPNEYGNMAAHFPMFYWQYTRFGTFLSLCLISLIGIFSSQSKSESIISFLLLEIFMLIIYKVRLKEMAKNSFVKSQQKYAIDTHFINQLYEDYFIRIGEYTTRKVPYERISKVIETDSNFYIELDGGVIIFQKNKCSNEAIEFIRRKCKDILNISRKSSVVKQIKNPEMLKKLMTVLFILNCICIPLALYTVNLANTGAQGFQFIKKAWIFWLWLPVPILSIVLGIKYRKIYASFDKNILSGVIVAIFLLIFGSFYFFPINQDYDKIYRYADALNIALPPEGELYIQEYDTYFDNMKDFVKIDAYFDRADCLEINELIKNKQNWISKDELSSKLRIFIPTTLIGAESSYFSIYNKTLDNYNSVPNESGEYLIYAMMFDKENKHLEINEYYFSYVK